MGVSSIILRAFEGLRTNRQAAHGGARKALWEAFNTPKRISFEHADVYGDRVHCRVLKEAGERLTSLKWFAKFAERTNHTLLFTLHLPREVSQLLPINDLISFVLL